MRPSSCTLAVVEPQPKVRSATGVRALAAAWAIPFLFLFLFAVTAGIALVDTHEPAGPVIALAALGISLYNLWRAEWRPGRLAALLVDHPEVTVAGNSLAVRFQITQPLIIQNVGGTPCVLVGVELIDPWIGGGNWFSAGVGLLDVVVPSVLPPRDPVIARLVFDQTAVGTSPQGERYDLAEAMEQLRLPSPPEAHVRLVYAADGFTRHHVLRATMNPVAVRQAFDKAQDRARWGGDDEPDLTMPGDEQLVAQT